MTSCTPNTILTGTNRPYHSQCIPVSHSKTHRRRIVIFCTLDERIRSLFTYNFAFHFIYFMPYRTLIRYRNVYLERAPFFHGSYWQRHNYTIDYFTGFFRICFFFLSLFAPFHSHLLNHARLFLSVRYPFWSLCLFIHHVQPNPVHLLILFY